MENFTLTTVQTCPLILDLDGGGISLIARQDSQAFFDFTHEDGLAEWTGWAGPGEAFLALDANTNDTIDSVAELFGSATEGGYTELERHDQNGDGRISAADPVFAKLKLWQDKDGDGLTDPGELSRLSDSDIASLTLDHASIAESRAGASIRARGQVLTHSSSPILMEEVWFTTQSAITQDRSGIDRRTAEILDLPDLRGFGRLRDLSHAMAEPGSSGQTLTRLVQEIDGLSLIQALAPGALRTRMTDLLYQWAGVQDRDPGERGLGISDARKLLTLEVLLDQSYRQLGTSAEPFAAAGGMLTRAFYGHADQAAAMLLLQSGALADLLPELRYTPALGLATGRATLAEPAVAALQQALQALPSEAEARAHLIELLRLLQPVDRLAGLGEAGWQRVDQLIQAVVPGETLASLQAVLQPPRRIDLHGGANRPDGWYWVKGAGPGFPWTVTVCKKQSKAKPDSLPPRASWTCG